MPNSPVIVRLLSVASLLLPMAAHGQTLVGRGDRVFTTTQMLPTGGAVRIYGITGEITITEGSDGRVEYRAEKRPRRGSIEDIAFVVRSDASGVTICAVFDDDDRCSEDGVRSGNRRGGWWNNRGSVAVTVQVPRGVRLRTSSGNGDVTVSAAVGELSATSGNGDVRVSGAAGPVRASSGNGDVIIATTTGPVTASSGNGDIRVTMDKVEATGDMDFSSGNGEVSITVPSDFAADLIATTGNGRIVTELPIQIEGTLSKQRLRGTINGGGRRLRMSTGNGGVEIRRGR
jgi:hypothetical protein